MPRYMILLALTAPLSACSVTAQPEKVPIVGPTVSNLMQDFNPLKHLDIAGLIQIDFRETSSEGGGVYAD